uniref:Lipocalin n=1 Tax=Rhipicephalus appendiculatus TaxID=34631 RepID=A0A131YFP3_RHIAP
MQVRSMDNVIVLKEKMLYVSRKYRCAVIKVTQAHLGREPFYELRIWDSFVKQGPNLKCVRQFHKHTRKGKIIYGPLCDNILHIK